MAEEIKIEKTAAVEVSVKICDDGFLVIGNRYGGDEWRAFSTPEGLIEWLSRELGAGRIVWGLTLGVWMEKAGIKEEDLLPVPDASVDPRGYQQAIEGNAIFLLRHFVDVELELRTPKPTPKPKKVKVKKPKEEKPKKEVKE